MEEPSGDASRRRNGPRLYHKKSRLGCIRCKQRRVKCDEKRPACTGCSRHAVECIYPSRTTSTGEHREVAPSQVGRPPEQESPPRSGSSTYGHTPEAGLSPPFTHASAISPSTSFAPAPSPYPIGPPTAPPVGSAYPTSGYSETSSSVRGAELDDDDTLLDPPESRERRLWELRLMTNYVETIHNARPDDMAAMSPPVSFLWTREVPKLAMRYDSILYGMLAHSALNLWTQATEPSELERLRLLQQTYLGMAVREQRKMVARLAADNADALCMSSLIILAHSFALVQLSPPPNCTDLGATWQPPLEWLRIGRATGTVFTVARAMLPSGENNITRYLNTEPQFDPDEIFTPENRADLQWIICLEEGEGSELEDREAADKITWRIYERVLSYTGWVRKATEVGEADFSLHRRFAAFAVWMPEVYQDFCQQRRQRALVTLAWFFGLWIPYDHLWSINGAGKRQVRAIYENLEPRWRPKVEHIMLQHGLM
ncbi:hypothetical protein GQ53DRAFT_440301 [Thozetella sp. PMI_491]|nr:hypothetical protein GQ53DRAFT_440301 [Thozetella sp. PMI_491]